MTVYFAECLPNQCVFGSLVKAFKTIAERDRWMAAHYVRLGHEVETGRISTERPVL